MANRNRVQVRRVGSSRRQTEWSISTVPTGYSAVAASTKAIAVLVPSSTLADIGPATVVRTHGILAIQTDNVGASEEQIGALGFAFVNEVAGSLGITGLPGPAAQSSWGGWFVHQFFNQTFLFVSGVGVDPHRSTQYPIDSKAMRKFEADESLLVMIENFGTFGFEFAISMRILVKAG